jgi:hypothetical protein
MLQDLAPIMPRDLKQSLRLLSMLQDLALIMPRNLKLGLQEDEAPLEPKHRHNHRGVRSSSQETRPKIMALGEEAL